MQNCSPVNGVHILGVRYWIFCVIITRPMVTEPVCAVREYSHVSLLLYILCMNIIKRLYTMYTLLKLVYE
jgi:hypothetical protein